MQDCIFCKIVKKESPATIVFENDQVIAFTNIHPVAETHLLIVPKEHIASVMNIENSDFFADMVKAAQALIKEKNIENGYKLVFNGGKYQAVPHLHWHLLGGEMKDKDDIINQT